MNAAPCLLLLASDHPIKAAFRLERPAPGVVAAVTAGDGESINPKRTPMEDSTAVVVLPSGIAALIADAHFGPSSGEIVARAFAEAMVRAPATDPAALAALMVEMDRHLHDEREPEDESETTALAVFLGESGTLAWASVGDSLLYVATPDRPLEQITHGHAEFLSGDGVITGARPTDGSWRATVDTGALRLPPGAVALVVSDGVLPEYSGMSEERLHELLLGPEPLDQRVSAIMREAGSLEFGGGKDNLSMVALTRERHE